MITADQVTKVAKLANLKLSVEEIEKNSQQLSAIIEYIEQLKSVDTEGVEPTFNVTGNSSVFRADESINSLDQSEALINAPKKENGFFVTKGVFGGE